jgi:large exoprotein involved in heme utilization and adhesion
VTLSNSDITANAFEGAGGNIRIVTDVFISDMDSAVDASSEKGIDGLVEIKALQKVVAQGLNPLPEKYQSAITLLREPCIARVKGGQYSSFVVSGRDAIPVQPGGLLPSPLAP